tara:strand:+ start:79699 stop:79899 length:201 start_codon:yes stop_codon:yes gene_type:complete
MPREPGTRELKLFSGGARKQPRDARGRFVRVQYSPERIRILETARKMRARLGLAPLPSLTPFGIDE